jgi:hypothetical protein
VIHKGRMVVAYAHAYNGKIAWSESLLKLQKFDFYSEHIIEGFMSAGGHFTTVNRNAVVEQFMQNENKPEWLLFVDTDIVFADPSIIYGLYQDADPVLRPIVSGLYFTYIDTGFTATWLRRTSSEFGEYRSLDEIKPDLQEVDGIGFGCVIIHRSVLEKLAEAYPREKDPWVWFGHDLVMTSKGADRLGEDLTFCRRAKELGFTIWGDGRLGFSHIKEREENVLTVMERAHARQFVEQEQARMDAENRKGIDAFVVYAYGWKEPDCLPITFERVEHEANGVIIP